MIKLENKMPIKHIEKPNAKVSFTRLIDLVNPKYSIKSGLKVYLACNN